MIAFVVSDNTILRQKKVLFLQLSFPSEGEVLCGMINYMYLNVFFLECYLPF